MENWHLLVKKGAALLPLVFIAILGSSQTNVLVGSWRLTAADKILPDGKRVADFGEAPRGIAIFTANGQYVVEIFETNRLKVGSVYKDSVLKSSCHFGSYSVDEAKGAIAFHINRASFPDWDETTSVRSFTLEGDNLAWRVQPRPDGSIPVSVFSRIP